MVRYCGFTKYDLFFIFVRNFPRISAKWKRQRMRVESWDCKATENIRKIAISASKQKRRMKANSAWKFQQFAQSEWRNIQRNVHRERRMPPSSANTYKCVSVSRNLINDHSFICREAIISHRRCWTIYQNENRKKTSGKNDDDDHGVEWMDARPSVNPQQMMQIIRKCKL